jgi:hypothetical protein
MHVEASISGRIAHASEPATLAELVERVDGLFAGLRDPERAGLYVVSPNAGFRSALVFWSQAVQTGVAFANPELFPWTLANAPCAFLARRFGVRGPNLTFTGDASALSMAFAQADEHLHQGIVDTAWIAAIDFADAAGAETRFAAFRLTLHT